MARKKRHRKQKYRVAIIGEGHTEWHYFTDLKEVKKYTYTIKPTMAQSTDYIHIFKKVIFYGEKLQKWLIREKINSATSGIRVRYFLNYTALIPASFF